MTNDECRMRNDGRRSRRQGVVKRSRRCAEAKSSSFSFTCRSRKLCCHAGSSRKRLNCRSSGFRGLLSDHPIRQRKLLDRAGGRGRITKPPHSNTPASLYPPLPKPLDPAPSWRILVPLQNGGVLVSTGSLSSELHAEDDSLASLNTGSKNINANSNELALAA